MPRRAGQIDAPTSAVQMPNLGSGAAHPATVQAYDDLAKAARSIGETLQPLVDANTEKQARAAVAKGDFSHTMGMTRQDQIYEKIIDAGFMAQASMDVDRTVGELENKHLPTLNMEEFAKDNDAARTLFLQGTDERYAPALAQAWDERALNSTQRLSNIATQKAIKLASEKMTARASQLVDEVSRVSNPEDFGVKWRLTELQKLQEARVAAGEITPEEMNATHGVIIGRITANRISDELVTDYKDGGRTDEAFDAAVEKAKTALYSPQLSLPKSERDAYLNNAIADLKTERSEAKAEERELAARIRQAQSDALSEFSLGYSDAQALAREGGLSVDRLNELMRAASGTRNAAANIAKVENLGRIVYAQQTMRSMSIPEQEKHLQDLEQAGAQGDEEAVRMLSAVRPVVASSRSAAEADPVTFNALRNRTEVPQINWKSPDTIVDTMSSRFHRAEIAGPELGVGVKYFSPADRNMIKSIADKGGPNAMNLAAAIVTSARAANVDPLRVMDEVNGGGAPLLATAGALLASGVPSDIPSLILSGTQAMGTDVVKNQMPSKEKQESVQRTVLGDKLSKRSPAATDALKRSADAYFAAEVLKNNGVVVDGPEKAYERAVRAVTGEWNDETGATWGGQADMRGGKPTVPPWMKKADFPNIVARLTPADIQRSSLSTELYGTLGKYQGRAATIADYRSAKLIDAGAGRYYVAPDPSKENKLVLGSDGKPLVLNLNVIREDLKQRSTAVR